MKAGFRRNYPHLSLVVFAETSAEELALQQFLDQFSDKRECRTHAEFCSLRSASLGPTEALFTPIPPAPDTACDVPERVGAHPVVSVGECYAILKQYLEGCATLSPVEKLTMAQVAEIMRVNGKAAAGITVSEYLKLTNRDGT